MSFYDTQTNDFKVEPGKWEIQDHGSSKDIRLKQTIVVEQAAWSIKPIA
jgi:hypothetical protein